MPKYDIEASVEVEATSPGEAESKVSSALSEIGGQVVIVDITELEEEETEEEEETT